MRGRLQIKSIKRMVPGMDMHDGSWAAADPVSMLMADALIAEDLVRVIGPYEPHELTCECFRADGLKHGDPVKAGIFMLTPTSQRTLDMDLVEHLNSANMEDE